MDPSFATVMHQSSIRSVSFDSHDNFLTVCDVLGHIKVISVLTHQTVHQIEGGFKFIGPVILADKAATTGAGSWTSKGPVNRQSFRFLITFMKSDLIIWDAVSGQIYAQARAVETDDDMIMDIATQEGLDTLQVVSCSFYGKVFHWSVSMLDRMRSILTPLVIPEASIKSQVPLRLDGISLSSSCRSVVSWGEQAVYVWVASVAKNSMAEHSTEIATYEFLEKMVLYKEEKDKPVMAVALDASNCLLVVLTSGWIIEERLSLPSSDSVMTFATNESII